MLATDPTKIVIKKIDRRLVLSMIDGSQRVYPIGLGKNWAADKAIEGDHATPLGEFYVCAKNPRSKYFRSLCISYPNAEDAERGLNAGLITAAEHAQIIEAIGLGTVPPQHTRLGGEIYIHGQRDGRGADAAKDWTRGCVALDDADMRELYDLVAIGTRVVIVD
jgi:murein L,D-transpeptidase YafK